MAVLSHKPKNVPFQISKEYPIAAYFRIFLPHISPCYGPHILKKIAAFFGHAYLYRISEHV